jgi:hypothetical protein
MGALRPGGHAAGCPRLTSGWSGAVSVCLRRHIHGLQERRRGIPESVGTAAPGAAARWPQARRVGSPDGGPSVRAQSEGHGTARGVAVRSLCQVALTLCAENLPGLREPLPTARSCHLPPRQGRAPTRRPPDHAGAPPTPRSPEEAVRPAPRPPNPGPLQGPQAVHPGAGRAGVTSVVSQRCCRQGA